MSQSGNIRSGSGGGGSGTVTHLQGDTGGPVPPTVGVIYVRGATTSYITGSPGTSTMDVEVVSTANTFLQGTGSTTPSVPLGPLTDGQLIIGSTGLAASAANLTAGTNITITNGPGSITINSTSSLGVNVQVFTTNGTYTPITNMQFAVVEIAGGGGGGSGTQELDAMPGFLSIGNSGGAGGYSKGIFGVGTIGPSQAVTVGSGGSGSSGLVVGGDGGTTSFGALMTATGGSGGVVTSISDSFLAINALSPGGTASGGYLNVNGQAGSSSVAYSFNTNGGSPTSVLYAQSGSGGSNLLGLGGPANLASSPGVTSINGISGTGYGSGGSAAVSVYNVSSTIRTGGNGANGIVIVTEYLSTSGGAIGFVWSVVTTNTSMLANHGYITNSASLISLSLPASASVGDIIEVCGENTGGWLITQASGQQIVIGNQTTTLGVLGSISSSLPSDCIRLVCTVTNNTFEVLSQQGNPIVA